MSLRSTAIYGLGALAGAGLLALSMTSASAFTLAGPSLDKSVAQTQIDKVWWDRWGRWHPNGYYYRRCWRGYYGRVWCN
jgi:hypothetical protein